MNPVTYQGKNYHAVCDSKTGALRSLHDGIRPEADWVLPGGKFGVPFVAGTQWSQEDISIHEKCSTSDTASYSSVSGATRLTWEFLDDAIRLRMDCSTQSGPRVGIHLDPHLLDTDSSPLEHFCMPHVLYTDENLQYAYLIFMSADRRYLALSIDSPFAAWRIRYSEQGHRMAGFQVLSMAQDVVTPFASALPVADNLCVTLSLHDSLDASFTALSERLGISIARSPVCGGIVGTRLPLTFTGTPGSTTLRRPGCEAEPVKSGETLITLDCPGIFEVTTTGASGRTHTSRLMAHESWETLYDRVNGFYGQHFQDESGAFYRVIYKDTLSPEHGYTMEGLSFGDVTNPYSCRTGEFGGFAAWAMMKNCLLFGEKPKLMESARRYLLNWALNRGHEQSPYLDTLYKFPQTFKGRDYGAYHLYQEVNYPQHEAFLLEQMLDWVRLTGDNSVLQDAVALGEHFVREHTDNTGRVLCQNAPEEKPVDYRTVHVPLLGLLRLSQTLAEQKDSRAEFFHNASVRLADAVCERGLDFPTEGEACTEDGSMACSVITLLTAYRELTPKPEYLDVAQRILADHEVLTLGGTDCRMSGSSTRFWETQYESSDWGPSINAGHAWSLWMAQAKALLALIDGDIALLRDSYAAFLTNLSKIDTNGGMPSCFTPDLIPGMPHAPYWGGTITGEDSLTDLRITSSYFGGRYVPKTYATSGNYALIVAADTFAHISGLWHEKDTPINGLMQDGVFVSAAPLFDTLLLSRIPEDGLTVRVVPGRELTVLTGTGEIPKAAGAQVLESLDGNLRLIAQQERVTLFRG